MKKLRTALLLFVLMLVCCFISAQAQGNDHNNDHTVMGTIYDTAGNPIAGLNVVIKTTITTYQVTTDANGQVSFKIPDNSTTVEFSAKNIKTISQEVSDSFKVTLTPAINDIVVITAKSSEPDIDRRDENLYKEGFAVRDDQILSGNIGAGINAGQHEGGGKSLEIRVKGYNLDHGGGGLGLKVLVDNFSQNQESQGHGQGYLGQLKSLTPELVDSVQTIGGPFRAEYGNFSTLGVVQILQRETLADTLLLKLQGGSFDTTRGLIAISPRNGFISYERARTDGPFKLPLAYKRDNVSGSYKFQLDPTQSLVFKMNFGRNDYISSGQIPLDLIFEGSLDRFGFINPSGGRVRTFNGSAYYRKDLSDGSTIKLDGYIGRSLFDLYSDFTFFLNNPVRGDEIQQHDSRLQEGVNSQYTKPYHLLGNDSLFTAGTGFYANQITLGLANSQNRDPYERVTRNEVNLGNFFVYGQNANEFFGNRLHIDYGVRIDYFHFDNKDQVNPLISRKDSETAFQPKFNLAYQPNLKVPVVLHFNYGRGVSTQDARGLSLRPEGTKVARVDFSQFGVAYNQKRFSVSSSIYLIDASSTQVYIPDDGSIEFKGPSRSYGYEFKGSLQINRFVSLNANVTHVLNAFYKGTIPREYVSNAPSVVGGGSLIVSGIKGFSGYVNYRPINSYRLDETDNASFRASGHDVVDFQTTKKLNHYLDLQFSIDNVFDKRYFETQNLGDSRSAPTAPIVTRVHGTPGYPRTFSGGVTLHFGEK